MMIHQVKQYVIVQSEIMPLHIGYTHPINLVMLGFLLCSLCGLYILDNFDVYSILPPTLPSIYHCSRALTPLLQFQEKGRPRHGSPRPHSGINTLNIPEACID